MPSAILLNPDDPIFAWEHMNAHRRYFAMMAPLDRFSALPYLLDPTYNTDQRATNWHHNHQKAHTDFATALPRNYNALPEEVGISTAQPLAEHDLSDAESLTWWSFVQHREHYLADAAVLPILAGTYPFW